MKDLVTQFKNNEEEIQHRLTEQAKLTGRRDQILANLETEFAVKSLTEAELLKVKLEKECEQFEKQLQKEVNALDEIIAGESSETNDD